MSFNFKSLLKKKPYLLAPMDEVTDIAFREICEKMGAGYTTSELSSVDALIRDKTLKSRYSRGDLRINCVQLFGRDPNNFVLAAKNIEYEADIIDVNFGCPSVSVTSNNSGSYLLNDPKNVGEIISKLVKHQSLPVTAKIRLGYTNFTYKSVAKEIEDAGASLITVHGRTAKQKYSGKANWDAIKEIYENSKIPIIGNGDISSPKDIEKYLNSHCSGFMIGRAAIGNPHIFKEFDYYFKNKNELGFKLWKKEIQKELFKTYIGKLSKNKFYNVDIKIQKQAMWFFKGISGAKELRKEISHTRDIDEIFKKIEEF